MFWYIYIFIIIYVNIDTYMLYSYMAHAESINIIVFDSDPNTALYGRPFLSQHVHWS